MNTTDAFKELQIPTDSNEQQIKKAHKKLSKKNHPDISDDKDGVNQQKLNQAREIALKSVKSISLAKIPKELQKTFSQLEKSFERAQYSNDTQAFVKKIITKRLNRLRPINYTVWFLTAILGLVSFLGKEVLPTFPLTEEAAKIVKLLTVYCVAMVLLLQFAKENIKQKIDLIKEELQDKQFCATEISRLLGFQDIKEFNIDDLLPFREKIQSDMPGFLIGKIRMDERIKLTILKAKENGLIELQETKIIKPGSFDKYILKFNPQDFDVFERLPEERIRIPKTIEELRFDFKTNLGLSVFFVITTAVVFYFFGKLWMILPAFFAFVSIANVLISISEIKRLKKNIENNDDIGND